MQQAELMEKPPQPKDSVEWTEREGYQVDGKLVDLYDYGAVTADQLWAVSGLFDSVRDYKGAVGTLDARAADPDSRIMIATRRLEALRQERALGAPDSSQQ